MKQAQKSNVSKYGQPRWTTDRCWALAGADKCELGHPQNTMEAKATLDKPERGSHRPTQQRREIEVSANILWIKRGENSSAQSQAVTSFNLHSVNYYVTITEASPRSPKKTRTNDFNHGSHIYLCVYVKYLTNAASKCVLPLFIQRIFFTNRWGWQTCTYHQLLLARVLLLFLFLTFPIAFLQLHQLGICT